MEICSRREDCCSTWPEYCCNCCLGGGLEIQPANWQCWEGWTQRSFNTRASRGMVLSLPMAMGDFDVLWWRGLLEGVFQPKIVEAIEIQEALSWIRLHRSNFGVVYLNSQIVINVPYSNEIGNFEFGLQIGKLMWRL